MASITPSSSADMPPESPPQEILDVEAPPQPQRTFEKKPGRLAMTWAQRVGIANTFAMLSGFGLGSTYAGRMAGFRYRAENAHRFPTTRPGWYLYHKTKNYVMMKDGIQEGVKRGLQFVGWTTLFFLIEESLDVFRGTWRAGRTLDEMEGVDELEMPRMEREIENSRDFLSTSVAGIVTAGVWSVWHHLPLHTAARTMRYGLIGGLVYGLGQDGLTWLRVNKYGYEENPMWEDLNEYAREKKEQKRMKYQTSGDDADQEDRES